MAQGKVTISRVSGGDGDRIVIRIEDCKSGVTFVEAAMAVEDFGYAVTGLAHVPASLKLNRLDLVGTKREHKDVFVPILSVPAAEAEPDYRKRCKMIEEASLAPFEIDGWKARQGDFGNSHRGGSKGYNVTFTRHVHE